MKRQIINTPLLRVYTSVMFHQNSFRVDMVLDGFDVEDSMDCALLEKWPVFHWHSPSMNSQTKCCLIASIRRTYSAARWRSVTEVGENYEDCWLCCGPVEDKDWITGGIKCLIQHWLHLPGCVLGLWSHVRFRFLTLEKKVNDIEIWWFNS